MKPQGKESIFVGFASIKNSAGKPSEVAHKWAGWLYITLAAGGVPNASDRVSGPGGYITPAAGASPTLQSGENNQKWPTSGPGGYITPAAKREPHASERGRESEVAHKWAAWLHKPCHLGVPQHVTTGGGGGAESEVAEKWAG